MTIKQFTLFLLLCPFGLFAQTSDPVLFTVGKTPVHVSEFKYIYTKTNGDKANFTKKSLEEYLDLYVRFKLKVQKAKELQLDTIPSLKKELEGYRQQLANSYLIDKEVNDKLVNEAYLRSLKDVSISHIFFTCEKNAPSQDTLVVYNKAMSAKRRLDNKEITFEALAKEVSDDKSALENNGLIGFVTALLPSGFYAVESAAYSQKVGECSFPIRSEYGYHLIKVNEIRDARGEVEVAHILVRKNKERNPADERAKIDSLYKVATASGTDFAELAKVASEDKTTGAKGGYVGFFGINKYEKNFEDYSFALKNNGEISKPFETSAGWHIVKRLSKKVIPPLETAKKRLKPQIQRDSRFELAKVALIEQIKKQNNFKQDLSLLSSFAKDLKTEDFYSHKWKTPTNLPATPLMTLANKNYTLTDFSDYLEKNSRVRLVINKETPVEEAVSNLYHEYANETCIHLEESQLEQKYPEFRSLMREYEEGILLFEATKNIVWDKASQDSVGLKEFYEQNKQKYQWDSRVNVTQYSLKETWKDRLKEFQEFVKANTYDKVLEKYNPKEGDAIVTATEKSFEKGKNKVIDAMTWKIGELSPVETDSRNKALVFYKIENILQPSTKALADARGYVVADYQDFLDKKWIDKLMSEYKVDVNKQVLENLVKK